MNAKTRIRVARAMRVSPDDPRFRSGVDVVQFTVTVLDKERRPVTGLAATDFDVLVDSKPRPIAAFAAVTLPDDTATVAAPVRFVAPDVYTNRLSREGRLVVIVMDPSIRNGEPMRAARAIGNAAIDSLGPADLAGVVYTRRRQTRAAALASDVTFRGFFASLRLSGRTVGR
jgi:hypothetical protein